MDENQSIISLVQKCSLNCIISPKSLVSTHLNELRGKEGRREGGEGGRLSFIIN